MWTGSPPIPQLKAAPLADQLAERLAGDDWAGIEIALRAADLGDSAAVDAVLEAAQGLAVTAEAPLAWPSGAFVSVDDGICERSPCTASRASTSS